MLRFAFALTIAVACFTLDEVKKAECNVYCRNQGYDLGAYRERFCLCSDMIAYDRSQEKKLKLPKKRIVSSGNVVPTEYGAEY